MYKIKKRTPTSLNRNTHYAGESIEQKLRRIIANKEQVKDKVDLQYDAPDAGVAAHFDIRSNKFEEAIKAMERNMALPIMTGAASGDSTKPNPAEVKKNMETEEQNQQATES